ncbi:YhcN/YlaJ family sporulation lipoprotein [Bacillus sp. z60-18]|uniref:YhcN/YlaJ family sporulation lipoprotein n=1 Tax=Bacillus TaxID=1386 RepID=UPI00098B3151|nr:YhcN/YlaJ family sporulation lipoprotein [Bacillus sonorensis]
MDKKLKMFSGILLLTAGLSACGTNNAMDNRYDNNARPIGYYSNDADRNDGFDNDGPVTDMLENMNGRNGTTNVTNRNGNPVPTGDGTYSRGDMNYHNHLVGTLNTGYDKPQNRKISRNITKRINQMNNIDESQAVVTDETVIIAVRADKNLSDADRNQMRQIAKRYAGDRTVQIAADNGTFTRLREMNDDPQNVRDRGNTTNDHVNRLRNQ